MGSDWESLEGYKSEGMVTALARPATAGVTTGDWRQIDQACGCHQAKTTTSARGSSPAMLAEKRRARWRALPPPRRSPVSWAMASVLGFTKVQPNPHSLNGRGSRRRERPHLMALSHRQGDKECSGVWPLRREYGLMQWTLPGNLAMRHTSFL
jgi:hypothetical protein